MLSMGSWVLAVVLLLVQGRSLLGAPAASALQAAGLALLLTLPGYLTRRLGAGDVKYFLGIGLLTSLETTWWCFVLATFFGALMALLWLKADKRSPTQGSGDVGMRARMPFGPMLSLGLIIVLWVGPHS